jgi:hypothetical protein
MKTRTKMRMKIFDDEYLENLRRRDMYDEDVMMK